MEADGAVDAQNAPTVPWKTLCVFHELPQGLSHQVTHEKLRKAPKYGWEIRIDPYFSPRSFWRQDVGVEWRQRLTALEFHGDRNRALVIRYLIGVDDHGDTYHTTGVDFAYEFGRSVALSGQGWWIRSPVYQSTAFTVGVRVGGLAGRPE